MTYTIIINETGPKAIEEDESDSITDEQLKELNSRFNFVLKNPVLGKTWDETLANFLKLKNA